MENPSPAIDAYRAELSTIFSNNTSPEALTQAVFAHVQSQIDTIPMDNLIYNVWDTMIEQASADITTHDTLIQFIRDFWSLATTQDSWGLAERTKYNQLPWYMADNVAGGPCEPGAPCNPSKHWETPHSPDCNDDESFPYDGTFFEKRTAWINYCNFAALLTVHDMVDCRLICETSMRGVLEGETFPTYFPDTAVMAFEKVIQITGDIFWAQGGQWLANERGLQGDELVKAWKGHEKVLAVIAGDRSKEKEVRESALRAKEKMREVRERNT